MVLLYLGRVSTAKVKEMQNNSEVVMCYFFSFVLTLEFCWIIMEIGIINFILEAILCLRWLLKKRYFLE